LVRILEEGVDKCDELLGEDEWLEGVLVVDGVLHQKVIQQFELLQGDLLVAIIEHLLGLLELVFHEELEQFELHAAYQFDRLYQDLRDLVALVPGGEHLKYEYVEVVGGQPLDQVHSVQTHAKALVDRIALLWQFISALLHGVE